MKFILVSLLTTFSFNAIAGFPFRVHRSFLSKEPEYLTASLQINNSIQSCAVDTGARYTIAKEFIVGNLPKVGEIKGGGISNTELLTDLVQTNLAVGDWQIPNAVIGRSDRIPFDCLIGNDFFLHRSFSINFVGNSFNEIPLFNGPVLPLDLFVNEQGGHFGFDVEIGQQPTESIFDTGASKTVIDKTLVEDFPENFIFLKELQATDGNSARIKAGLYRLKSFKFGSEELNNIEVYVLDLSALISKLPTVRVVVGLDLIYNYNWFFNPAAKVWSYERR
jgi:hypothetical protein